VHADDLDVADELEAELHAAEAMASALLAAHSKVVNAALVKQSKAVHRVLAKYSLSVKAALTEHSELANGVRAKLGPNAWCLWTEEHTDTGQKRRCERCPAAEALLSLADGIRFSLQAGDAEQAAIYALRLGHLRLRIAPAMKRLEDDAEERKAYRKRQAENAHHKRGPDFVIVERARRDQKILDLNIGLLTYPNSKKRRLRYDRVDLICSELQRVYQHKRAEAQYSKSEEDEAAAEVWKIGTDRIDQIIPRRRTKKTS